jgi:HTH-type transcriptional regulator/antitoxin HigA
MDEMAGERQMCLSCDDAEYGRLVDVLDQLIEQIGEDETHPLASLMEVIGVLIERYEDDHVPELDEL